MTSSLLLLPVSVDIVVLADVVLVNAVLFAGGVVVAANDVMLAGLFSTSRLASAEVSDTLELCEELLSPAMISSTLLVGSASV